MTTKRCAACNETVPDNHPSTEQCPHCEACEGYMLSAVLNETIVLSDSIRGTRVREFLEDRPKVRWAITGTGIAGVIAGLLGMWPGFGVGLVSLFVSYRWGHLGRTRVRERDSF